MPDHGYKFWARQLHRVALAGPVAEMSFTIDRRMNRAAPQHALGKKHVFVAGLPRAGTTVLMRILYETGEFCSLTYMDMPFPLAPGLWRKIAGSGTTENQLRERVHGDGIMVNHDSPEALEEVFWRVFCMPGYIFPDRLTPVKAHETTLELFRKYIAGLLEIKGADRYLSKNNNNILRIASIIDAFPSAAVIIPFRDPVQQALSLYNQHLRFLEIHGRDSFSAKYMKWLVHHEFGSDHKPFDVSEEKSRHLPANPAYWLDQWISVYGYLLEQDLKTDGQILFVEYERMCDSTEAVWRALAEHVLLPPLPPAGLALSKAPLRKGLHPEGQAENRARQIYSELQNRFEKIL
ncbi:MAG: sulfotransferase [Desulfobacterales bacterium]